MKFLLSFFLIFLCIFSCDEILKYNPSKDYNNSISEPSIPDTMEIILNNSADTLYGWGNIEINYKLIVKDQTFNSIKFYIDNVLLQTTADTTSLVFDSKLFNDGIHILRLELLTYTRSGSIADQLNSEFFTKSIKKIIYFENTPPSSPLTINAIAENGTLTLNWQLYPNSNFQNYILYKHDVDQQKDIILASINDQNIIKYIDSTYIGGETFYKVNLAAADTLIVGNPFHVSFPGPQFIEENVVSISQARLKWNSSNFYKNFDHYRISKFIEFGEIELFKTNNYLDTVFTDSMLGFGNNTTYKITTVSKRKLFMIDSTANQSNAIYPGTKFPGFYEFEYRPDLGSYYLDQNGTTRYNINDDQPMANAYGQFAISTDGQNAIIRDYNNNMLYKVDPLSFQVIDTVVIDTLFNYMYDTHYTSKVYLASPNHFLFSNNRRHSSHISYYTNPTVIDLSTMTKYPISAGSVNIAKISNNGEYLLMDDERGGYSDQILRLLNDFTTTRILIISNTDKRYFMMDQINSNYIFTKDSKISVYSCANGQLLNEFTTGYDLQYPTIDPVNPYIGGIENFKFHIYDLNSGQWINTIQLAQNTYFSKILLIDNTLYSSSGYKLELD